MGQLVFQAALGGQVNLVGPNTASTFNLNVPAASDTLVARATTDTLTNKTLTSPVISGGTIDNAVIGGTTAVAGSFTTVTAGTSVTAPFVTSAAATNLLLKSAGTTAVTIDTSQNVGIGTSSPAQKLHLNVASGAVFEQITSGSNSVYLGWDSTNSVGTFQSNTALTFATGASYTERARIDSSGNVGIGTSSPAVKLDVAGNATIQNGVLTIGKDTVYDAFVNSPESMYFNVDSDGNSTGNRFVWGTDRAGTTGGTEWMRIDSSGNLLVGVTSANANGGVLQLKSGITFPATQVAATDANTLDDYEEGTFTPVAQGATTAGTATYSVQVGQYTKIGNRVFYNLQIIYTGGTGTGYMRVGGLPFTSNTNLTGAIGSIYAENLAGTVGYVFVCNVIANTTYISVDQVIVGGGGAISTTYDGAANISISGHYFV